MMFLSSISVAFKTVRAPVLNHFAIFDTESGLLQWHGRSASAQAALSVHLQDVGYIEEVSEYQFRVLSLDDAQYASLLAWWSAGEHSPDYPPGMPSGVIYKAADVIRLGSL